LFRNKIWLKTTSSKFPSEATVLAVLKDAIRSGDIPADLELAKALATVKKYHGTE
jgi:hypothetical protein